MKIKESKPGIYVQDTLRQNFLILSVKKSGKRIYFDFLNEYGFGQSTMMEYSLSSWKIGINVL